MRVQLKLFATLSDFLPPGAKRNAVEMDVPEGATPHQIMDLCRVPRDRAHLVVVNGTFVPSQQRDTLHLAEGDDLALWPPVAGG
jgi:sulfur carrier protein ThiS